MDRLSSAHQTHADQQQWVGYFSCIRFTVWMDCLKLIARGAGFHDIPDSLFSTMLSENSNGVDDFRILKKLADLLSVHFVVWIIDHGVKYSRLFSPILEQEGQQRRCSFIVLCKDYGSLYLFYMSDRQKQKHTVFPTNDEYILKAFQDFRQAFDRLDVSHALFQIWNGQATDITHDDQQTQNLPPFVIGHPTQSTIYQQSQSNAPLPPASSTSTDDCQLSSETNHSNVSSDVTQVSVRAADAAISRRTPSSAEKEPICRNYRKRTKLTVASKFSSTADDVEPATASSFHKNISLPKLELINQPKRLWHSRYFQDGVKGPCTTLQAEGETQQTPLKLKFQKIPHELIGQVYIGTRVVTFDILDNEQNFVVPKGTLVRDNHEAILNKMDCFLVLNDVGSDLLDRTMKCVFSEITPQENKAEEKQIIVSMVKLYQSLKNNKKAIKTKKLHWSRLEFALYIRPATNSFVCISPPSYSDLIRETQGTQDINAFPPRVDVCEKGEQIIAIPLDASIQKDHINICLNDRPLKQTQFQKTHNVISFVSPRGTPGNDLHIKILQTTNGAPTLNKEVRLPYRIHDDHEDPCGAYCQLSTFRTISCDKSINQSNYPSHSSYRECIITFILLLLNRREKMPVTIHFSIETLWNSSPITNHRPVQLTLSSTDTKDHLLIEIDAPFFNDPAPLSSSPGSYPELWNYEVVELFFLSSSSKHYLELEFSPHGHYLVLLLLDRRKELKQMLPLSYYEVERPSSDRWIGRAHVPRTLFPAHVDRFNAYAIHGQNSTRTYESLYPATSDSEAPDFHRLEFFKRLNFDSLLEVGDKDGDQWNSNHL